MHLQDGQLVYFGQGEVRQVAPGPPPKTHLTAWFQYNREHPNDTQHYLYCDFPEHFVWDAHATHWKTQHRNAKKKKPHWIEYTQSIPLRVNCIFSAFFCTTTNPRPKCHGKMCTKSMASSMIPFRLLATTWVYCMTMLREHCFRRCSSHFHVPTNVRTLCCSATVL